MSGPIEKLPEDSDALEAEADLPPVVARLVVEIRSDGSRTIARGALEDRQSGQRVQMQANATTPLALAKELTRVLLQSPVLAGSRVAGQAVLGLLPEAVRKRLPRRG